jgi:hypothetical protein
MEKEPVKPAFEVVFKCRMSDKLATRLIWLLLAGGAGAAALAHLPH